MTSPQYVLPHSCDFLSEVGLMLFDFDGTIANTEPLHWQAYRIGLKELGVVLNDNHINKYIGNAETEIYRMIKNDFSVDFDENEFFAKRILIFLGLVEESNLQPYPVVSEIIRSYGHVEKYILSSQNINVIHALLARWQIEYAFSKIISSPVTGRTKESIIRTFGEYWKGDLRKVAYFEDLSKHALAGHQAGMRVIGVTTEHSAGEFQNCDAIILLE